MFQTGLTGVLGSLGSVSKSVLLLLFIFSVISWAIIFSKWRVFRVADLEDKRFLAILVKARDLGELYRQAGRIEGSPSATGGGAKAGDVLADRACSRWQRPGAGVQIHQG